MFFQQGLKYSALEAALSTLIFTVGSAGRARRAVDVEVAR
jgi:hypothetical protein